ncbi:MAG TPA: polyhydroxyalkanoate granule-associated phasin [Xanthomonadaceae bacterium]|nr:polyhydroxyalkanoate granule-associated phasin [Xanthomonadaceae bacterium]
MAARRTRRSKSLAVQTMELGVAAPQVIAHRLARMALAGASPSARDRKELRRMGTEKVAALNEAWSAMALEAFQANQRLALSFMQSLWFPWVQPKRRPSASRQLSNAALGIFGKGMAPVRRRAVANAKRLGRIKRR